VIGVVGPRDSIALIKSVAKNLPGFEAIVFLEYQKPAEAIHLARELDKSCNVILFSGRLPHALALNDPGAWSATLIFVPHTTADLYRTISYILMENGGEFISFSLDVLSRNLVDEVSQEINMPEVKFLYDFDSLPAIETPTNEEITGFHTDAYRAGAVTLCVTCLGFVYEELTSLNIPAKRVEHSRGSIRGGLERAQFLSDLRDSQSTGLAVAVIQLPATEQKPMDRYDLEIQELRRLEVALKIARKLRGQVASVTSTTVTVTASRGVVETVFERIRSGQRSALEIDELPLGTPVGFGVDLTLESAERNAHVALEISRQQNTVAAVLSDGSIWTGVPDQDLRTRDSNAASKKLSDLLGMGPLALSRLLSAFRRLDTSSLTARQLGDAYGIEARSARRLLNSLAVVGFANEKGKETSGGAGRPQTVFQVDVPAIIAAGTE